MGKQPIEETVYDNEKVVENPDEAFKDGNESAKDKAEEDEKWEFEDYAFTITGVIVGFLLVGPELLQEIFDITIFGGSLSDFIPDIIDDVDEGILIGSWNIQALRALSPMLFLLTTTICFFKDAYDARTTGGYAGSVFTHTFESLLEDAIYMAITTAMVYGGILFGAMYASWLAGPITWILFMFIFPLVRKKSSVYAEVKKPWFLLFVFSAGIIFELITGAWIAFPMAWLIICVFKFVDEIKQDRHTIDSIFNVMYYGFSVILMAVGVIFNYWIVSWIAFPVGLIICWILSKTERFKKVKVT